MLLLSSRYALVYSNSIEEEKKSITRSIERKFRFTLKRYLLSIVINAAVSCTGHFRFPTDSAFKNGIHQLRKRRMDHHARQGKWYTQKITTINLPDRRMRRIIFIILFLRNKNEKNPCNDDENGYDDKLFQYLLISSNWYCYVKDINAFPILSFLK